MFDSLDSSRELKEREKELWLGRQKGGKLRFMLLQTLSFSGLVWTIVGLGPHVIFGWHFGTAAAVMLACLSISVAYVLSEALWRRGLRVTNEDAPLQRGVQH